jgi:ABC-type phosphate/phosphonate transport system permease subunit
MQDETAQKKQIELTDPPERLVGDILRRVSQEEEYLRLRRTFFVFCVGLTASAVALVVALANMLNGMSHSGFSSLLSLLFSDTSVVLSQWQNFGYSLLEALPIVATIAVLALTIAFLNFSRLVLQDVKQFFRLMKPTHH